MNREEFVQVCKGTIKEFDKDDIPLLAAALTYYSFFSLFPLLLLAVTLASLFLKPEDARSFIFNDLAQVMPGSIELLQGAVDEAFKGRNTAGWLALVGLVVLAFSAASAFGTLDKAINRAWNTEKKPSFIKDKLVSFALMSGIAVLLLISVVASTIFTATEQAAAAVLGKGRASDTLVQMVTFGLSLVLTFLVFSIFYRFLPRRSVSFRNVWLGALLAAIAWVLVKEIFAFYLGSQFANFDAVYGTMGTVIALLTWIYVSAVIILTGAEFAAETDRVSRSKT